MCQSKLETMDMIGTILKAGVQLHTVPGYLCPGFAIDQEYDFTNHTFLKRRSEAGYPVVNYHLHPKAFTPSKGHVTKMKYSLLAV